jgi:hypothetical protein
MRTKANPLQTVTPPPRLLPDAGIDTASAGKDAFHRVPNRFAPANIQVCPVSTGVPGVAGAAKLTPMHAREKRGTRRNASLPGPTATAGHGKSKARLESHGDKLVKVPHPEFISIGKHEVPAVDKGGDIGLPDPLHLVSIKSLE